VFTIWIKFVALIPSKQNIALFFYKEKYKFVRKIVTISICS